MHVALQLFQPFVEKSFVENTIPAPLSSLDPLVKNELTPDAWLYSWTPSSVRSSVPLIHMFSFVPVPHYLVYCALFQALKSRDASPPAFLPISHRMNTIASHVLSGFLNGDSGKLIPIAWAGVAA